MGNVYQDLGQYNEAKEYYEKALIINKKIFGEEHASVATSYNNLGSVYQHLGQYNEAKEYHEKALIIRKKIFGEEHADVAASYNNLGNVYQDLGQYNEAKEYYEKALIIRKRFSARNMLTSQQAITTWEMFIKILDSTMKQKNTTKRH